MGLGLGLEPTELVVKLEQTADRGLPWLDGAEWGATARVTLVFEIRAEPWVVVAMML